MKDDKTRSIEENLEILFDRLWSIPRSLTGNGNRQTLEILSEFLKLNITEIPSGVKVFDWIIPHEWNVKQAFIETIDGERLCDFSKCNLHLLGYSIPVDKWISYEELASHIYTLEGQPDLIPYVTSYYKERWGFCMSYNDFKDLDKTVNYRVVIDSSLDSKGSLTYGEAILPGKSKEEIVFSTYICHPSMANNELSGPLVTTFIYMALSKVKNRHYTYRFIFTPETVGTIAYLSRNLDHLRKYTKAGFVVTCVGDNGSYTYKQSKDQTQEVNQLVEHILLNHANNHFKIIPFTPIGSDERQYSAPGVNLPFGSLMRTMYGEFEQYHTSADNKEFISFEAMKDTIDLYVKVCMAFESNHRYINLYPFGEPFLSKHNLYPNTGITSGKKEDWLRNILFILNYSDGKTDLLDIANKLGVSILSLTESITQLKSKSLISQI
jgi:aminopeptidase-like protein